MIIFHSMCGHVNVIFTRLAMLETQLQRNQDKITTDQDAVQINVPDFDLDIDRPATQ